MQMSRLVWCHRPRSLITITLLPLSSWSQVWASSPRGLMSEGWNSAAWRHVLPLLWVVTISQIRLSGELAIATEEVRSPVTTPSWSWRQDADVIMDSGESSLMLCWYVLCRAVLHYSTLCNSSMKRIYIIIIWNSIFLQWIQSMNRWII